MRQVCLAVALGLALAVSGLALGQSQSSSNQTPSLGDLAKQLRAQREKSGAKPKVFTNDNLPARPPQEKLSVASGMSTTPGGEKSDNTADKDKDKAATEGKDRATYYRNRAAEIQRQLSLHQRELDVLQQKSSQGQMQYYSDPLKTLQQSSTPSVNSDANKLHDDIDKKKQQIADDQKALDDLTDELRREGGDPGWIR